MLHSSLKLFFLSALCTRCCVSLHFALCLRQVEKDTPTVFPAVTVCNLSPMPRVDALKDHPTWGVFIQVETSFNDSNGRVCQASLSLARVDGFFFCYHLFRKKCIYRLLCDIAWPKWHVVFIVRKPRFSQMMYEKFAKIVRLIWKYHVTLFISLFVSISLI